MKFKHGGLQQAKALELGWGGITKVVKLTGMSHTTIRKGIRELQGPDELKPPNRLRKPGGVRKKIEIKDPKINQDLEAIMNLSRHACVNLC